MGHCQRRTQGRPSLRAALTMNPETIFRIRAILCVRGMFAAVAAYQAIRPYDCPADFVFYVLGKRPSTIC